MRRRDSRFSWTCFFRGHRWPGGRIITGEDFHVMARYLDVPCERCGNDRFATSFRPDTLGHWLWLAGQAPRRIGEALASWCRRRTGHDRPEPDDIPF